MKRNEELAENRTRFIKQAFAKPEIVARELEVKARKLQRATKTGQKVKLLSSILFLSERTIWNEIDKSGNGEDKGEPEDQETAEKKKETAKTD